MEIEPTLRAAAQNSSPRGACGILLVFQFVTIASMNSFFCGSGADIENRFFEFLPDRRSAMCYFSFMVFFLLIILTTEQFAPNMLLFAVVSVVLVVGILWMYTCCQQGHAATRNEQIGHTEQQLQSSPILMRAHLPEIRTQLALLNRDFDERDYDALRMMV